MRKFVVYELSSLDFVGEILYPILCNRREARKLEEDFGRQAKIELDPKSFWFSNIISGLNASFRRIR